MAADTPMITEPVTYFTHRLDQVAGALSLTHVVPEAAPDMVAADNKITEIINEFNVRIEPRAVADYAASARKWATKPTKAGLDRLIDELNAHPGNEDTTVQVYEKDGFDSGWKTHYAMTPYRRRMEAMRQGILDELFAAHDKPDFAVDALIESCKDRVRAWFAHQTKEFNAAWNGLDEAAQTLITSRGKDSHPAKSLLDSIDPMHTPEATITAYRRFARVWAATVEADWNGYDRLGCAMAFNEAPGSPSDEKSVIDTLKAASRTRFTPDIALWANAHGCALHGLGAKEIHAVTSPGCEFSPLPDPLGADREELNRRVEAFNAAGAHHDYVGDYTDALPDLEALVDSRPDLFDDADE